MASRVAEPVSEESYPMTGGDGTYSYTKNSTVQGGGSSSAKTMVMEAIKEKLDLKQLLATSSTLRVSDLGCSVGPNTFFTMDTVLEGVEHKCIAQGLDPENVEYQVFFSDHTSNDFNTLFASLPAGRKYFAVGVPGSFHGRLFPSSSMHFVHSSYALPWLSKVPDELLDKASPAWNKGRIHYHNAPTQVGDAYSAQYARDIAAFLDARAKELAPGGMLMLIVPAVKDGTCRSNVPFWCMFHVLGLTLMDMAKEGLLSEAQVDSFNLPVYAVSPKEMAELVEENGCFSIERKELTYARTSVDPPLNGKELGMNIRSAMEGIISKHFGPHIIDQLFHRFAVKSQDFPQEMRLCNFELTQLFLVLKRK